MITEDYVSFETTKLLKEKGFDDEYTNAFYDKNGNLYFIDLLSDFSEHPDNDTDIAASTLYVAMKWLREIHNLHIMVDCIGAKNYKPTIQFTRDSRDIVVKSEISKLGGNGFDSNEQACEAAIKYCLENLI